MLSSTRTELSAKTEEDNTLLLQNQGEGSPLHLTNPDVQFFMIEIFTSGKAKCAFPALQRHTSVFKILLPPSQKLILLFDS